MYETGKEPRQKSLRLPLGVFRRLEDSLKRLKKDVREERGRVSRSSMINAIVEHHCSTEHVEYLINRYKRTLTSHNKNPVKTITTISLKAQEKIDSVSATLKKNNPTELRRFGYSAIVAALVTHHCDELDEIRAYIFPAS